jgi:hypothetical protein
MGSEPTGESSDPQPPESVVQSQNSCVPDALMQKLHEANARFHNARSRLEQTMDASEDSHQERVNQSEEEFRQAEREVEEIEKEIQKFLGQEKAS